MRNAIDLKNKNVLVTGGGQGIGAEICKTMAACGTDVLVNYHTNRDKAKDVAWTCAFLASEKRFTSPEQRFILMGRIKKIQFLMIRVLINNYVHAYGYHRNVQA